MLQRKEIASTIYNYYIPFLFFFIIACGLWFLTKITKTYITEINYPVEYIYQSNKHIIASDLPSHMKVKIRSEGYKLIQYQIQKNILPVVIDLNEIPVRSVKKKGSMQFFFKTEFTAYQFAERLKEDIILSIKPDTVYFKLSPLRKKRVPVAITGNLEPAQQHMMKGYPQIIPDSILISGPKTIVDTIHAVYTEPIHLIHIKDKKKLNVSLQEIKHIQSETQKVEVTVEAEKFTEHKLIVPIQTINTPPNTNMRLFPASVEATFHVGISNFKTVNSDLFVITANYDSIFSSKNNQIPLLISQQPLFIKALRLNRNTVEFLIEKND